MMPRVEGEQQLLLRGGLATHSCESSQDCRMAIRAFVFFVLGQDLMTLEAD
jgi:hypothetical protein